MLLYFQDAYNVNDHDGNFIAYRKKYTVTLISRT